MKACRGPQAFPKSVRLLRRSEFRRVYDEGQRRTAPLCTVFFCPNRLSQSRLGITVPARLGSAAFRNRVKRRLREAFRLSRPGIAGGWDIVLNPRAAVATVPFEELRGALLRLLPGQLPSSETAAEARPR